MAWERRVLLRYLEHPGEGGISLTEWRRAVRTILWVVLLSVVALCMVDRGRTQSTPVIAIQPFGPFDAGLIEEIRKGISKLYLVDVVVLGSVDMPSSAYYEPRKRYWAGLLLDDLEERIPSYATKILGVTDRDISTTKGGYYNWGIFGLGRIDGKACVVSSFRLGRGDASHVLLVERLVKVVNHELGHTFGLHHCPTEGCLMEDARGTIVTVDNETGHFCERCAARVKGIARQRVIR
jgi:archaemetzincin